ncbi:ABC transporter substrate-binding protein [Xanthobacter sediminis]
MTRARASTLATAGIPRRRRARRLIAAALAAAIATPAMAGAPAAPRRIVSLNLCADELVLRLAPKGAVVSVTSLASDPISSTVTELAAGIPVNRGLAEEVVPLAPDLVIAGAFTTRTTVDLLKRFDIPVMDLGIPGSLEEGYAQIRAVAARLGVPEKGEAMVEEIRAAIAAVPPPRVAPRAVVMRPNGFTVGRNSLPDDLMRRAGLDNLAARLSPDKLGQLALEEIVAARPDVLVVDDEPDAPPSLAHEMLQHPAVRDAMANGRTVAVPTRLWACVGPQLVGAFARLSQAAHGAAPAVAAVPSPTRTR